MLHGLVISGEMVMVVICLGISDRFQFDQVFICRERRISSWNSFFLIRSSLLNQSQTLHINLEAFNPEYIPTSDSFPNCNGYLLATLP